MASNCNTNPFNMTAEEYFDENYDKEGKSSLMLISIWYEPWFVYCVIYSPLNLLFFLTAQRDIGRNIEEQIKTQKFKATLWLSEDYPLQLKDQVLPIIDLMALNNAWFKKLRDFITLQVCERPVTVFNDAINDCEWSNSMTSVVIDERSSLLFYQYISPFRPF